MKCMLCDGTGVYRMPVAGENADGSTFADETRQTCHCCNGTGMIELPSAYQVVPGPERPPRWYPMRFGKFRLDSRGYRISFSRREDAEAFCHNEQAEYVRAYPSVADR